MRNKLCFSLDPFQLPTKTEPTKERAVQPAPTRKPTVIRIPAKPGKCKHNLPSLSASPRAWGKYILIYQCLLLKLCVIGHLLLFIVKEYLKTSYFFHSSLDSKYGFHFSVSSERIERDWNSEQLECPLSASSKDGRKVHLTLEKYRHELCRSTYMHISYYSTVNNISSTIFLTFSFFLLHCKNTVYDTWNI